MTRRWQVYELNGRLFYIERDGTCFHRYESRPQVRQALEARRGRQPGMRLNSLKPLSLKLHALVCRT